MLPRIQHPQKRPARIVLLIGLALSIMVTAPSVSYSARYSSTGNLVFHVVFNVILFAALCFPFLILYLLARNGPAILSVTFGTVLACFHGYLIYTTYRFRPQEFGYLGLVVVPFFELLIAVPVSFLIVFLIRRVRHSASNRPILLSLCKLFGVEVCTLFGTADPRGPGTGSRQ